MAASGGDARERLSEIWEAWGLSPDETMSEAQHRALAAVETWLEQSKTDPTIAIRATQVLLLDPERPDAKRRPCWVSMRGALKEAWKSAGMVDTHLRYAQALLLAAWPDNASDTWLFLASLLDSAWDATRRQNSELVRWRLSHRSAPQPAIAPNPSSTTPQARIATFGGIHLPNTPNAIANITNHQTNNNFANVGPQLVLVLQEYRDALQGLSGALSQLSAQTAQQNKDIVKFIHDFAQSNMQALEENILSSRNHANLLWWGQSRYCKTTGTTYRRMRSDPSSLLWWASHDAASLSLNIESEPAAAYLAETLHSLGQDIFEKKTLSRWMEELQTSLISAKEKAPTISTRTEQIIKGDALGLPVTWIRHKVAQKELHSDSAEAIALNLDTELDRGEWASWIFREVLLDLHLADDQ